MHILHYSLGNVKQKECYNKCMSENEIPHSQEIREEFTHKLRTAKALVEGRYVVADFDQDSHDPSEVFQAPLLDLNDPDVTDQEKALVIGFMEESIGHKLDDAPVQGKFISSDGLTRFKIFDVPVGAEDDKWLFSEWQNEGEKPSYTFWSEEMYYIQQMEAGYEEEV